MICRDLSQLQLVVLNAGAEGGHYIFDLQTLINVAIVQFRVIEIKELPTLNVQAVLWLSDHQMNMKISEDFGAYFARMLLKATPNIMYNNALQVDWVMLLPPERGSYVLCNTPYLGESNQSAAQKVDMQFVCGDIENAGLLDYVAVSYVKALPIWLSLRVTKSPGIY
jgi:hypothetical protein